MGKKIGIMTFWTSKDNYGQILQAYALQTVLRKMGHEPFLIRYDYRHDPTFASTIKEKVFHLLKDPAIICRFILSKFRRREKVVADVHDRKFDEFIRDHMTVCEKIYTDYRELKANPPEADVYICGSDVVWYPRRMSEPYFLDFNTDARRVAYAPSFGTADVPVWFREMAKPWLEKFYAISTREQSGADVCNEILGTDRCVCNLDPTLLLQADDYRKLFTSQSKRSTEKYCLAYFLGTETDVDFYKLRQYAANRGMDFKFIPSQGREHELANLYPDIPEWLQVFAFAECICTNSFHGCVFAVIFRKKFLYFPIRGKYVALNNRVYSLLDRLGIDRSLVVCDSVIDFRIDYAEQVEHRIDNIVNGSMSWLMCNLLGNA